ncbi:hypothetical protein LIER_27739 [Lithospermum erythrorhizon]|uniref:Uncharacterized protein n=1 Tax=Lithospermum erythrorhizon TaxID=34254 RepID=A0AAV3RGR0_LITER
MDPKHSRGTWKDSSSSYGSTVVSPVFQSPEGVTPSVVPDDVIRDQGFFQKAREMDTTSSVTSPDSSFEALQKLSLLRVKLQSNSVKSRR